MKTLLGNKVLVLVIAVLVVAGLGIALASPKLSANTLMTTEEVVLYYQDFRWDNPEDVCTPQNNWCGWATPAPKAVVYGRMYTTVSVPPGVDQVTITINIPCSGWGEGLHGPDGSAGAVLVNGEARLEQITNDMPYHHGGYYRYETCDSFAHTWNVPGVSRITLVIEMRGGAILDFLSAEVVFSIPVPTATSTSTVTPTRAPTPTLTPSPTATWLKLWLPLLVKNWCSPAIKFTHVPPYGSFEDLQGQVRCVEPAEYKVAVYIFVSGWWNKPTWAWPLTTIREDGSWTCDITTGGIDQLATKIIAFLVPNGYNPPLMSGGQTLPSELYENAVAEAETKREAVFRKINFSGYTWKVKASETQAGPGPNYFSDREEDVWVDGEGRLHLRIVYRDGRWYCAEVFTEAPLGYGKYIFLLASRVDQLDKNIVLGLFTWDDTAPEHNYREIDIEFSRWGEERQDYAQYVVQPWDHFGNLWRFNMVLTEDNSTHGFDWQADQIFFQSLKGHQSFPGPREDEIGAWIYRGFDIPPAGEGNARINLWLFGGYPPSNSENAEMIIDGFQFIGP